MTAARLDDEIVHGWGLLGMVAGAIVGAVVAAAIIAGTAATGGLLLVAIVGGCIAGGGLAGGALARGISKAANLSGPTTGRLARGSPNVTVNRRAAMRAGVDYAGGCNGLPINHFSIFSPVRIAEGSRVVSVNGKPMGRLSMKMECGAKIKTGSPDVTVGGPTARVLTVIDTEEIFEGALMVLGVVALGAGGIAAFSAGLGAGLIFTGINVGGMVGMDALHSWGESLGPGLRRHHGRCGGVCFVGGDSQGGALGGKSEYFRLSISKYLNLWTAPLQVRYYCRRRYRNS